jgi:hypothetical protein
MANESRKAEDGRIDERYNLVELLTSSYPARTRRNIEESDGTVIFSLERLLSGGTTLTWEHANKLGKPVLHIYDTRKERVLNQDLLRIEIQALTDFLRSNKIEILNVAGPREPKSSYRYRADASSQYRRRAGPSCCRVRASRAMRWPERWLTNLSAPLFERTSPPRHACAPRFNSLCPGVDQRNKKANYFRKRRGREIMPFLKKFGRRETDVNLGRADFPNNSLER